MRSLRSAIGKDYNDDPSSKFSESQKVIVNNSQSIWSIGDNLQDEDINQPSNINQFKAQLIGMIKVHENNGPPNQYMLTEILACYSKIFGSFCKQKQGLENIQKIVKRIILKQTDHECSLEEILELIKKKLKKIKKKEQKNVMQFDQIAEKLFKKPHQNKKLKQNKKKFLQINLQSDFQAKPLKKNKNHDSNGNSNGTKNSGSGSQDSGDKKLGKLLTSGSIQHEHNKANQEQYTAEGYNFSAVMSGSLAIKQRSQKSEVAAQKIPEKFKRWSTKKDQSQEGDDAFIFYRPNKGKK